MKSRDSVCCLSSSSLINSRSKKVTATYLCCILLSSTLLADAALTCTQQIEGSYRDCLCGIMYKDVESHCQDEDTYYPLKQWQENLSCPFSCLNGGLLHQNSCLCNAEPGAPPSHGLCCEVPTPYCGEFLWKPEGEIKSPGFDLGIPYLPNSDCVWKISTGVNKTIALSLVEDTFEIEEGSSIFTCNKDYLEVYDGENDKAPRLGSFCGDAYGMRGFRTLYSSGRHLYLKFKSNGKNQKKGFHLHYRTFLRGTKCGRTKFSLPTGLISSPQYPLNYRPGESCDYEIMVKPGHNLDLITSDLKVPLQGTNTNCTSGLEDRIQVLSKKVGSKIYTEEISFCGNLPYPDFTIKGASSVWLRFNSNSAREGRFLLQYLHVPVSLPPN